ncbi:MAG: TIGR03905 family TSCPD domain-containing protein [Defluviitaleaceae bacterium]|nr:TIGR03905 family TSCPD domain-containing protein [Defluviitaleaceae bacterium]MCL2224939.1 TIGR03905 family TSCPD domain-containing protein [Defluviitaleaceae bacterium]MCL2262499.1 TIGR03905 family TSCPD domain-containing protein [Defluviitaleaceae bacterium]
MTYKTKGVCCDEIQVEVSDGIVNEVKFSNGCNGNLKGIAELAKGRKAEDLIASLSGIQCGVRGTSCPDQLAAALKSAM